jgi:hypothetical protein
VYVHSKGAQVVDLQEGKCKVVSVHVVKTYSKGGYTAPDVFNLGTVMQVRGLLTPQPLYPLGENPNTN